MKIKNESYFGDDILIIKKLKLRRAWTEFNPGLIPARLT